MLFEFDGLILFFFSILYSVYAPNVLKNYVVSGFRLHLL